MDKKLFLVLAVVLASCGGNDYDDPEIDITKNLTISSVSIDKGNGSTTSFSSSQQVELGLFDNSGSQKNVLYRKSSGSNVWSASNPIKIGEASTTLYAYYPYSSGVNTMTAIPVQSSLAGTDYMYATSKSLSSNNPSWSMTLNPALVTLNVTIKKDALYIKSGAVTSIGLASNSIAKTGKMNIQTGKVTATSGEARGVEFTGLYGNATSSGITLKCILIPSATYTTKQSVTLSCTIDGDKYSIALSDETALRLQQGVEAGVVVIIKPTGLVLEKVTSAIDEDVEFVVDTDVDAAFLALTAVGIYDNVKGTMSALATKYDEENDQLVFGVIKDNIICQFFNADSGLLHTFSLNTGSVTIGENLTLTTESGSTETVRVVKKSGNRVWLYNGTSGKGYILALNE